MNMDISIETVTPETAEAWLGKNMVNNRKLRSAAVAKYSRDMKAGTWQLNGESIKFDRNGELLDGQHRLHAIVHAGVSIDLLVVRNLDPNHYQSVDTGLRRGYRDVLKLRGETNTAILAATLARITNWNAGERAFSGRNVQELTFADMDRTLEENPHIRDLVKEANRLYRRSNLPPALFTTLFYIFDQIDSDDAAEFMRLVATGDGLNSDHPIYLLRKRLAEERQRPGSPSAKLLMGLTIKAWNAWRKGETPRIVSYSPGGKRQEKMPEPI